MPMSVDVRHGVFKNCYIVEHPDHKSLPETGQLAWVKDRIVGKKLHEIRGKDEWNSIIASRGIRVENEEGKPEEMGDFLARMFSY